MPETLMTNQNNSEMLKRIHNAANGLCDIYQVDFSALETALKKHQLPFYLTYFTTESQSNLFIEYVSTTVEGLVAENGEQSD